MLIDIADSGVVWANTGLDLTAEVIKRFDAATKTRRSRSSSVRVQGSCGSGGSSRRQVPGLNPER